MVQGHQFAALNFAYLIILFYHSNVLFIGFFQPTASIVAKSIILSVCFFYSRYAAAFRFLLTAAVCYV